MAEAGTLLAVGLLGSLRLEPVEVVLRSAGRSWRRGADGAESAGAWLGDGRSFAIGHDPALNIEGVANIYQRGVLLQTVTRPEFRGLSVHVNDDGLTLDASSSKAVADQRIWDALSAAVDVCRTVPEKARPNSAVHLAFFVTALAVFCLVALKAYPQIPASDRFGRLFVGAILGTNILVLSPGILGIVYRLLRAALRSGKS